MAKYRKLPVVIDAVRVGKHMGLEPEWFADAVSANKIFTFGLGKFGEGAVHCVICTLEGTMRADDGDYIIRGIAGEFYPCKPEIFHATYEAT